MDISQRGLSSFGMLVVLAVAVAAGYYAYKGLAGGEDTPTCKSAFNTCMQKCRRTTTETAAAQSCQQACQRDEAECSR